MSSPNKVIIPRALVNQPSSSKSIRDEVAFFVCNVGGPIMSPAEMI
jgi:hypothetical protein